MKRLARYAGLALLWLLLVGYFTYLRFPYVRLRPTIEPRLAALGLGNISFGDLEATPLGGLRFTDVRLAGAGPGAKPIQIERLDVSPALWKLVRGARGAKFDAQIFGGRAKGTAAVTRDQHTQIATKLDKLDLAQASLPGLPDGIEGLLSGSIDLDLERMAMDAGKGTVHLEAEKGSIPPSVIKVTSTPVRIDKAALDATVDGPKVEVSSLTVAGPDLEGSATGTLTMRGRSFATSDVNTDVKFRLPDGSPLKAAEALIASFRVKKDADGYFDVKLGGSLQNLRPKL